ncbi:DUF4440 domain-containing protein [Chromatiaceae bacterium AAb-1]|nr:DUF4440 domain-containing protein [Chromatiaceae bacterium AAb-1]
MPHHDVDSFFQQYAAAYSSYDSTVLTELFSLPCLLLADEHKSLLTDEDLLARHIEHQFAQYRKLNVVRVSFRVQNQVRLADNMAFVSLYWRFLDAQEQILFTCHASYTLQMKDQQWYLVAIVTDDESAAYQRALRDSGAL